MRKSKALPIELQRLTTERRNPAAAELDTKPALEIARILNAEDATVPVAVGRALPHIARAIEAVAEAIGSGGRLIYVGAGTSGRIAAIDAAECPPTFDVSARTVQFVVAGGKRTLWRANEAAEDSAAMGRRDLATRKPGLKDVVVGLAASGRTPYTVAAVQYARRRGARTVGIACVPGSPLGRAAEIEIVAEVGPEAVSGSTRMKAGTAEKMICNLITTGAMARLGYVYGNLMVNLHPKNEKLVERAIAILQKAAGADRHAAARALKAADSSVSAALVMLRTGASKTEALRRLRIARGNVRRAIESSPASGHHGK